MSSTNSNTLLHSHRSPLYGPENFATFIKDTPNRDAIASLLDEMWTLTSTLRQEYNKKFPPPTEEMLAVYKEHQAAHKSNFMTLPLVFECSEHSHVLDVLRIAARIYRRAFLSPPIQFKSPLNAADVQLLTRLLCKSSSDDFWVLYPGVQLWMLLVGLAAAASMKECAYFMMLMTRVGKFTEAESWQEIQTSIRMFLLVQRRSEVILYIEN
jgi:hypothetical protein